MNLPKTFRATFGTLVAMAVVGNSSAQTGFSGLYSMPLIGNVSAAPLMLMTMQRDSRLFVEAYDDASDINGDGIMDTKYNPALREYDPLTASYTSNILDYYGYFDSYKCYEYTSYAYGSGSSAGTINAFVPIGDTDSGTKKCTGYTKDSSGFTKPWSGDFLNYLTTTRIDALRKVLYGGKRIVDLAYVSSKKTSHTVLERANIPQDLHAFGKEYNSTTVDGYDISEYTPLSAPSAGTRHLFANVSVGKTSDTGYHPSLLVLTNRTERAWDWIASEFNYVASNTSLNGTAISPKSFDARVVVCDTSGGVDQTPNQGPDKDGYCKTYNQSTKPTGILNEFGEQNSVYFGLLTGTAKKNFSGGMLRKAISTFSDEVDSNGLYYKSSSTTNKLGIVYTIDSLAVTPFTGPGWGAYSGQTGESSSSGTVGNPIAEMMYEGLRYLAGQSKTSSFSSGITISSGVTNETPPLPAISTWTNPYGGSGFNLCAKPTQMVISDVNPTFDSDSLPGSNWAAAASFTGTLGTLNVSTLADEIWSSEGLGTQKVIIGEKYGDTNAGIPMARNPVTGFSQIRGLVPEDPMWQGSYLAAAVAKYGKETDLKTMGNSAYASSTITSRTVNTSAVALSSALPRIELPVTVGGTTSIVTVIPYAQTNEGGTWKFAEFIKLFVDNIKNVPGAPTNAAVNGGYPYYKMQVVFSDNSLYRSNAHDNDMDSRATYEVYWDNTASKVIVNVCADPYPTSPAIQSVRCNKDGVDGLGYSATGVNGMHLGYSIYGVQIPSGEQPVRLVVRNNAYNTGSAQTTDLEHTLDLASARISGTFTDNYFNTSTGSSTGTVTYNTAGDGKSLRLNHTASYTLGSAASTAIIIPHDPLWYAAKYGGYNDDNSNKQLDGSSEWLSDDGITPNSYFKVINPALLKEQLTKAITPTLVSGSSFAATASNSTDLKTLTGIYQGKYIAKYWSGRLTAYGINTTTGTIDTSSPLWEAATGLPAYSSRKVYTYRRETPTGIQFKYAGFNTNEKAKITSTQVDYILGLRTNEGTGSSNFRVRDSVTVLGDIVNSPPTFAGSENLGYSSLAGTEGSSYTTFVNGTKSGRTKMVYVGANDGMLHAFRSSDGVELFAYIPRAILWGDNASLLSALTAKTYSHKYYVDGPQVVGDYYDNSLTPPAWKSALVGTLGAGGKSIYALDITDPDNFSASSVMWEFSHPELGYVRNPPLIARLNDGNWYAIVGNGFESSTCSNSDTPRYTATDAASPTPSCSTLLPTTTRNAKLFIIKMHPDLSDGWTYGSDYFILHATDVQTATTPPSATSGETVTYDNGTDNGLAGPTTKDKATTSVSFVYAGDLQGNIWKFDLSSSNPNSWGVAYKLFQAKDSSDVSQPITSTIAVGSKPNDATLACVSAGTGRFVYDGDLNYKGVQTAYGIQDSGSAIGTRSTDLQQYTITDKKNETYGSNIWNLVYVSNETFDTSKKGWFVDLREPSGMNPRDIGERIIQSPIQTTLRTHELMAEFVTSIPTGDTCDASGKSYVLDFNACTGEALSVPTFDLDGNLVFDGTDKGNPATGSRLSGVQVGGSGGGHSNPAMCFESSSGGLKGCSFDIGVLSCTDGRIETVKKPPTSMQCGVKRTSWRQLR